MRIRSNRVLYEEPPERQPGQRGRPRRHGDKFKLSAPSRAADRVEFCTLLGQQVHLLAWQDLHFYKLPFLVGMVLCVQFLKAEGAPLQASALLVLDRPYFGRLGRPGLHVLVALCHRAHVQVSEATPGLDHLQLAQPSDSFALGLDLRSGLHPTAAHPSPGR
ncbi:MAG: hypothetical protein R3C14_42900 [Caldilineaceae bacterium]